MTDPRAKMRALRAYHYEHNALSGREGDLVFDLSDDEAIALLDAERPSVPMAMLKACNRMRFDYDADTEFRELELGKIADRYGFGVTEE